MQAALTLQSVGGWDIEVAFVGYVVRFDQSALRALPERIVVKRLAETHPLLGAPSAGASAAPAVKRRAQPNQPQLPPLVLAYPVAKPH